jgi:Fe-S cluster assembly ATPase SufC
MGPNGAGKSTASIIAGNENLRGDGEISLEEKIFAN